jgi:hypothetical protein
MSPERYNLPHGFLTTVFVRVRCAVSPQQINHDFATIDIDQGIDAPRIRLFEKGLPEKQSDHLKKILSQNCRNFPSLRNFRPTSFKHRSSPPG